ncbi:hypothetical protein LR48_Vigan10g164000 [Vigna angularis]|uniref:DUF8039 domain-containing protein n=1 Tax=Phaseolus angularis TaxID=3914 RepID=A0A0L9VL97_PHAAN|nr:hypothetical protein LR48_Vigan10g164000 [Vigna angularis]
MKQERKKLIQEREQMRQECQEMMGTFDKRLESLLVLQKEHVEVMVEMIHYGDVAIPIPTLDVHIVLEALQTFVTWPKHLVNMTLELHVTTKKGLSLEDPLATLREVVPSIEEKIQREPKVLYRGKIKDQLMLLIHYSQCLILQARFRFTVLKVLRTALKKSDSYRLVRCNDKGATHVGFVFAQQRRPAAATMMARSFRACDSGGVFIVFVSWQRMLEICSWQRQPFSMEQLAKWWCSSRVSRSRESLAVKSDHIDDDSSRLTGSDASPTWEGPIRPNLGRFNKAQSGLGRSNKADPFWKIFFIGCLHGFKRI